MEEILEAAINKNYTTLSRAVPYTGMRKQIREVTSGGWQNRWHSPCWEGRNLKGIKHNICEWNLLTISTELRQYCSTLELDILTCIMQGQGNLFECKCVGNPCGEAYHSGMQRVHNCPQQLL